MGARSSPSRPSWTAWTMKPSSARYTAHRAGGNGDRDSKLTISFTPPMDCLRVESLPEGDLWTYEVKLDGYRAQAIRDIRGVRLLPRSGRTSRRNFPLSRTRFPALLKAIPPWTGNSSHYVRPIKFVAMRSDEDGRTIVRE